MTTVQKKIASAVNKTRRVWALAMGAITIYTLVAKPLWMLLLLIPVSVVSYLGFMALTALWLTTQISVEENDEDNEHRRIQKLKEDLENGNLEPGSDEMFQRMQEAGLTEIVRVGELSPTVLGHFGDYAIHEWVEVHDPRTKQLEKFYYHAPLRVQADGTPDLPEEDGKLFACVEGIVYVKEDEPCGAPSKLD